MNSNHNAHHLVGLPEWVDQETADAAVAALGLSVDSVASEQVAVDVREEWAFAAKDVREEWAFAANFFWATAYQALAERDFRLMRAAAKQGSEADEVASPQGALLAAVFGGSQARPPERVVQVGRTLPVDQCRAARKAVQAEMKRFADASAAKRQAAKSAERTERAAGKNARVRALPPVGTVLTVRVSYRLKKVADNVASFTLEGELLPTYLHAVGVKDGDKVRVTSHKSSRHYGKVCDFTAEVV